MKRIQYLSMVILFCSLYSFAARITENKTIHENGINPENTDDVSGESIPEKTVPALFEKILALNTARIGNSSQIVLVTNDYLETKEVKIQTFEKINGQWVEKFTSTMGTIGRSGFARYKMKKEGDGMTPTGIFYLGPVYGYPGVKVSTKMEYWEASENDYWIDDIKSPQYNRWVTSNVEPKFTHERMKRDDDKYKYGIAIQYNMDQVRPKGSVITVHLKIDDTATAGCVAVPERKLIEIIGWLDPVKKPLIIAGTETELLRNPVSGPTLDKNDKYIWKREKYSPPAN
jgi:L,D-peptidoglycan transpeptidase YkuD (ErfK/YbiS/YcfS/YnhG family)